jgi:gluconate 2-dehydrogenase gamma chain
MVPEASFALDRRALLRGAILLVGGSIAGVPDELLAQVPAAPVRFFTPAQFATLAETADIILPRTDTPGAKDAGVPEALDALMTNWASKARKREFKSLIDEIGARAAAAGSPTLAGLPPAKRVDLVRGFDAEKMKAGDKVYGKFKELVLNLYYLSEPGATKELRYELIPGKFEPWTEMAPDTRAWAV